MVVRVQVLWRPHRELARYLWREHQESAHALAFASEDCRPADLRGRWWDSISPEEVAGFVRECADGKTCSGFVVWMRSWQQLAA